MKAVEPGIRLDENRPVDSFVNALEQQAKGCILVAKGRVNIRRLLSETFVHLLRLIDPAPTIELDFRSSRLLEDRVGSTARLVPMEPSNP
jgi:hypothetical protein